MAFLPDGNSVATGSEDKTVRIWDIHGGQEFQRLTDSIPIDSLAISPNGDLIATAGESEIVHLWDRQSGKNIRSFEGHTDAVLAVAFSPDGKWLATSSADHTVRLMDAATGTEIRRFNGHQSLVHAIAFSPDGTLLATGSGANLYELVTTVLLTWDPKKNTAQELLNLAYEGAIKAEHTIRLWNASSGTEIKRIDAPGAILALAFPWMVVTWQAPAALHTSRIVRGVRFGCWICVPARN